MRVCEDVAPQSERRSTIVFGRLQLLFGKVASSQFGEGHRQVVLRPIDELWIRIENLLEAVASVRCLAASLRVVLASVGVAALADGESIEAEVVGIVQVVLVANRVHELRRQRRQFLPESFGERQMFADRRQIVRELIDGRANHHQPAFGLLLLIDGLVLGDSLRRRPLDSHEPDRSTCPTIPSIRIAATAPLSR